MLARITRVAIRNYRSIGSCDVELQPLTLLVGPNGSGKSNFLDALLFLKQCMESPMHQVAATRSGMKSILRKRPDGGQEKSFSIRVGFELGDGRSGFYSLTLGVGSSGGPTVEEEVVHLNGETMTNLDRSYTFDRPNLVYWGAESLYAPVLELLSGVLVYQPDPSFMRLPVGAGPAYALSWNAANAANLLARLEAEKPEVAEIISEYVALFNPELRSVKAMTAGSHRWMCFPSASSTWVFNAADVSDGTLRAVGVLLAIFQSAVLERPTSLVMIEEPEVYLHPSAAGILMDALREGSQYGCIIAATHSADLLDRGDIAESSLVAVAMHHGESVIGPIASGEREVLKKRLATAGELMRTNYLSPLTPA